MNKKQVEFTAVKDGSKEDIVMLYALADQANQDTPERILKSLEPLKGTYEGYQISRYEHSLQAATRAYRQGESEEIIIAALLHDIGDFFAPYNAAEMAAAVIKPYVSEKIYWIVKHHSIFQKYYCAHYLGGDRFVREQYRDSPFYQATVDFCEQYDQNSFDPNYDTLSLEFFKPIVRKVFARPLEKYQFIPKLNALRD